VNVRARDVYLEDVDWLFVQEGASLYIVLHRETADIRHDAAVVVALEARQFVGNNMFYARVLKSHSVDHTVVAALCDTRQWVAVACLAGSTFEGDTAKAVDIV
jgi:hypothetical protein